MKRINLTPRTNWQSLVEKQGFLYHTTDDKPYWDESVAYEFTQDQINMIESATNELHDMALATVDYVISTNKLNELRVPENYHSAIKESWQKGTLPLYGRMDFSWNGKDEPKLLEYNADTPVTLFESSIIQWYWMKSVKPNANQFNSIHERLIEAWKYQLENNIITKEIFFTCLNDINEDVTTTQYIMNSALEAGLNAEFIGISDIGWNGRKFITREHNSIHSLFKLYPWESIMVEEFGPFISKIETINVIEPIWKMILANKALMVKMWELFPGHKNLLPTFTNPGELGNSYVAKPYFAIRGNGVHIVKDGQIIAENSTPNDVPLVYQQICELPNYDGNHPVIGSWMIGNVATGIGIRESGLITNNDARFVPHYVV